MHIVVAGGHGKIALRLTRLLAARGDSARSLIRRPEHSEDVRAAGGEPVVCDLEVVEVGELASTVGDADAIVFAAGAGPGSGAARKDTMDYGGAAKLIAAAEATGVRRFVMISSMGANAEARGSDTFSAYLRAKGRADDELIASGLDYTVVRPGRLTNDPGNGRVRIGAHLGRGSVPRDDVAEVIAASLDHAASIGKVFEVLEGDDPVADAIGRL
jgi:uncharacterized protein YbjT (DUF2867 family)